ncbi:unnamed protein product [Leuciscus chuanchicus]
MDIFGRRDTLITFILPLERGNKGQSSKYLQGDGLRSDSKSPGERSYLSNTFQRLSISTLPDSTEAKPAMCLHMGGSIPNKRQTEPENRLLSNVQLLTKINM